MYKKVRMLFGLMLVIMLTACNARGSDSTNNVPVTENHADELVEVPMELPTVEPTVEPIEMPAELPTEKPTVAQTATPILTPEVEVEQTPGPKGDIPERSYDSHRDFPYENKDFVDDTTYLLIFATDW